MERLLSESRASVTSILQSVERGCADLQEASSLVAELTSASDSLAGLVQRLLGDVTIHNDATLMLVPAVIDDAPLPGNLATILVSLNTARGHLDSSSANLRSLRRELGVGVREIPVEAALDSLQALAATDARRRWWRHPLALEWGTHLGQCLAELASAGESLAVSIELAVRADGKSRLSHGYVTTTTSDLAAAASTSAECVAAVRTSMAELRVLSRILARGIRCMGLARFNTALSSVPAMADSDEEEEH